MQRWIIEIADIQKNTLYFISRGGLILERLPAKGAHKK
jgi:hypothetical protein